MLIRRKRGWELRESAATPEAVFRGRRKLLKAAGRGRDPGPSAGAGSAAAVAAAERQTPRPGSIRSSATRATRSTGRSPTPKYSENYNNFYEFGTDKSIADDAQALKIRPWTVKIDGMVEKPIDDRDRRSLEEDAARGAALPPSLRRGLVDDGAVERLSDGGAWSTSPSRSSSAKYVRMETFLDPKVAPGQKQFWYPWPYIEGLTMAEATQRARLYGDRHVRQAGAEAGRRAAAAGDCRGNTGSNRSKSIVQVSFTDKRPVTFWETAAEPTNTAFGPTSTPRCRTRAGARRPSACSAPTSACRP